MVDINKLLEQRIQRAKIMIETTAKKIIKKEIKKLKKDIIQELRG